MTTPAVSLRRATVTLPTHEPHPPQKLPMFLEKRVYQGSSGRVYPLPVTDRIAEQATDRVWDAVYLENEFLRIMVLPEIGGRIHVAQDKLNGYDFIYRQDVIKPALVGLAGPWLSGGIEFNWPQHHRPSTFMPCDVHLEAHADGSKTVWLSEHDPMQRMKGMHGVCLHPGRAVLELKVRAYNRTPFRQTFLWWANVATRVHEGYQSFFPPDVHHVADHAKRSMSAYPLAPGRYYGVAYGERAKQGIPPDQIPRQFVPPHARAKPAGADRPAAIPGYAPNDLRWYANIPAPTSYMCTGSRGDFFGGYDFHRQAGIIHVANHHIAPGKKQWTWGNQEFGYAWDRNLTVADARGEFPPYIELMAGVYTDNQPDFSFLQPGETKTWSQFWYPIRAIGPARHATVEAALSLTVHGRFARIGIAVTRAQTGARLRVMARGRVVFKTVLDLHVERPHRADVPLGRGLNAADLSVVILSADGRELLRSEPPPPASGEIPPAATEPPPPAETASADELHLIGLHLEQYRHATRSPEPYWREALRRDPGDARCNHALGAWHLRRGECTVAEGYLRAAIARLTQCNPNPADGEAYYTLGLCLRAQALGGGGAPGRGSARRVTSPLAAPATARLLDRAYDAFYKSTWNQAWQAAGFLALAECDCARGDWLGALEHLERALRANTDNLRARDLQAIVLRRLGREAEAEALLRATLALDPLDWWARHLLGEPLRCDTQTRLDLVHDYVRAGFLHEALSLIEQASPEPRSGTAPLVAYTAAWICHLLDDKSAERRWRTRARAASPDYCFPARLEEFAILEWATASDPRDARAAGYFGHWLYDRRRHREALRHWERAARLEPGYAVIWRNLGIGYYNILRHPAKARRAYERAFAAAPDDARLFYERDQLWKRIGVPVTQRLRELERHQDLVQQRDDLTVEYGALLLQRGRAAEALALVMSRRFQPWEGGEGLSRGVFVRAHLALGRQALAGGDAAKAREHCAAALTSPETLGEARHLLSNPGDVYYWLGCACAAARDRAAALDAWRVAAELKGDFQEKHVTEFSEKTYFSALAWEKLGRRAAARGLLRKLLGHARDLPRHEAKIDYFATSLPTMILFDDDLQARRVTTAKFLEGLAQLGLGQRAAGCRALREVLRRDPSHAGAVDHLG